MRSSQDLVIGQVYTRAELRKKFDIQDATLNNGIFRPKGHESVWLFVTKNKTSDRTQYHDSLDGDELTMQGQTKGRTDHLVTDHEKAGQELLLFYRQSKLEYPGAGFIYEGPFEYADHEGELPTTFTLRRAARPAEQGKFEWQRALEAVIALDGQATPHQLREYLSSRNTNYNEKNLHPDLALLSVNSASRTSYHQNYRPRRTDEGSRYDRLFKVGRGKAAVFELYDPDQHGVWEIYPDPAATSSSGMSVRLASSPIAKSLEQAAEQAEQEGVFDAGNVEDARRRVMSSIVRRRGQAQFRKSLMEAYGGACALTGCPLPAVLEAAHIHPYRGGETNSVSNGLLLRTDLHTLFDLGLIAVDSVGLVVRVSPELKGSEYEQLDGKTLRGSQSPAQRPSSSALDWHRSRCGW